jgi:mannose-6-phosphate isomerase-like protein (cupin superfamily)
VPRAGETTENPPTGETTTFVVTAADSDGALLQLDVAMAPGRPGPPMHVHRSFAETHDVREGRLGITMEGSERVIEAPGTIQIPRATPHTFRVVGDEPVRTVVEYRTPGRYEDFIDRLYALAREGKVDDKGAPKNILQTAVIARPHLDEFALAKPPYAVQKALFAVLAPVGRLFGFRP